MKHVHLCLCCFALCYTHITKNIVALQHGKAVLSSYRPVSSLCLLFLSVPAFPFQVPPNQFPTAVFSVFNGLFMFFRYCSSSKISIHLLFTNEGLSPPLLLLQLSSLLVVMSEPRLLVLPTAVLPHWPPEPSIMREIEREQRGHTTYIDLHVLRLNNSCACVPPCHTRVFLPPPLFETNYVLSVFNLQNEKYLAV